MTIMHPSLLTEIEDFLSQTGMGESYFGKAAVGNSELVSRLRDGRRVWPETEASVLSFIEGRKNAACNKGGNNNDDKQGMVSPTSTIGGTDQ